MSPRGVTLISVLVATRNRAALLRKLLDSIAVTCTATSLRTEVIVIDNGSTDGTEELLRTWARGGPDRVSLNEPKPGRASALNHGLEIARGDLIAFTDDDVEVPETWIDSMAAFLAQHPEYDAVVGPVYLPPEIMRDGALLARVRLIETLPLFDCGDKVCDAPHLIGGNTFIRRTTLQRVGHFNELLGVGASGYGEDTDLGMRITSLGGRIGYAPDAGVIHCFDPARMTVEYYHAAAARRGRSWFVLKPDSAVWKSFLRVLQSVACLAWARSFGSEEEVLIQSGGLAFHRERLILRWRYWRTGKVRPSS